MKSILVLAICFAAVCVEVTPALSRGKRDKRMDVSQGQLTADEIRQLKAILQKMPVETKNATNSPILGPTTSPDRDGQTLKTKPTVTATGKSEGVEALEIENHSHSTELQKEKSPTSKSAIADIRDQLSKLSDSLKKLKELVLTWRENTPGGSQQTITKTKEDNTKLTTPETPEDEITTPNVTEKTKATTTYKPPTNISQKAVEPATTKFTNAMKKTTTAKPTTNMKAAKANVTTVKETANVTVTTKNTTPDVTTTPKDPIKKTTTAKPAMNSVTRTTRERTSDKLPTTKAANATKPPTEVTLITEKKTTDKTPTPRKPTTKISKQINNGTNGTSTVNVKTKELAGGAATPSTPTAATKFNPRTWVKNISNFPMVLMVAILLTVFLAMGYYNRRKIQNTIKKTCNVKQKTDRGYVKVKLEDEVELPRDANREYIY